ncbi:hypothetical protein MKQ70_25120 [Chitinophaga sedimenti]|uniref:hypothetical protein n=1 Tax=Chitinophaga sedimenti TaxID=2033606 RepID=UPI0020051664|nr:hypothetical protein [Chitinophaga sedimenti]MCK7558108.1 hypothetical protein [Chitinophaga sedimenti]
MGLVYLRKKIDSIGLFTGLGIIAILILATLISPLSEYTYGALLPFLGFVLMISIRWRDIPVGGWSESLLFYVSVLLLVGAVMIITKVYDISPILKNSYSAFYPDLLMIMLDWGRKPVLTFATHSIAGFYFFIFFLLNYKTYQIKRERKFLLVAYLFLISSLF